ncbi:hypothetical protein Tco_1049074 [Tanacetum coccineum]
MKTKTQDLKLKTIGDALKQYEANIKVMKLILIFIPNDIYNTIGACQTAREIWLKVERLMQGTVLNKIVRKTQFNNELRSSSNTRNQEVVQADMVNIQSRLVRNDGRIARRSYNVQKEIDERSYVRKETENVQINLQISSSRNVINVQCYNYNQKGHYARVILSNEQNDFLLANVVQMEELKELSANICMMARIQSANIYSNEGLSYNSAFISEVQTPSTSYMNSLFTDDDHEQTYLEQPIIINSIIDDDQINSNIIFDNPNVNVNNGSVDHDKNVHDSYELEQLARNAYKEAEKQ